MAEQFDLTAAQTAIWLDQVFFSNMPIYNTGQVVVIDADLDKDLFAEAIRIVVQKSDSLRLKIAMHGDAVHQEVCDLADPDFSYVDMSSQNDPLAAAQAWIEKAFWQPLNWDAFPLFRFALIRLSPDRNLWLQKYHHLVIDATGRQIVTKRVAEIYAALRGGATPDPRPDISFAAAADADATYRNSVAFAADRDYWLARFSSLPNPLVGGDRRRSERGRSGRLTRLSFRVERDNLGRLEALAKAQRTTLFKLLVGLIYVTFSRLHNSSDLVFGIPLGNRGGKFDEAVGLYSQVMPFRLTIEPKVTFGAALEQIDKALSRDYRHRRFPVVSLGTALQLSRQGRFGLYDVSVNYIPSDYRFDFDGASITVANLSSGFFTPWAITIADLGAEPGLDVTIDYDNGVIEPSEAERVSRFLAYLLSNEVIDIACPLSQLRLISQDEEQHLFALSSGPSVKIDKDATLTSLFAAQAARTPHAIAAVHGDETIEYLSLQERAEALAETLTNIGVGPDTIVGICLPRSIDLVIAVLGVLRAGGAYLPLDPAYPSDRIAYIVGHANARVIITNTALSARLPATKAHLLLAESLTISLKQPAGAARSSPARAHNLAYVIYTSGSTGLPKGVAIEHRNAVNLALWGRSLLGPEDLSGVLFSTSLNFDLSVYELFTTLISGGRLIIVESLLDIMTAPARDEVRLINTVPSLLDALLKVDGCPLSVRTVNTCGEPLSRNLADRLFAALPDVRFFNFYGPTETTVYSTWSPVSRSGLRAPPIGKALWNTGVYVVDADLKLVPEGVAGELLIGGSGVARGYLNAPDLTDERFLDNPFGQGRVYRTGDLVRWNSDGDLEFIERVDGQVKINGLRVELGEIETQLLSVHGISAAACTIRRDKFGIPRLLAYAIAGNERRVPAFSEVREHLERQLPRHMIPSSLTWLAAFPLTPNGKLDRKQLPSPPEETITTEYTPPRSKVEETLAAIWRQILKIEQVGANDDFFNSGGDSLQATLLILRIEKAFGVNLPAEIVLGTAPTIAGMAREIERRLAAKSTDKGVGAGGNGKSGSGDVDFVGFGLDREEGGRFHVDARTGLRRPRPNATLRRVTFNAQGYRGPVIQCPKPRATIRIAFMGNSVTFDPFASGDDATWPHLSVEAVKTAFPGTQVDYVNAGMPGYSSRQLWVLYNEYLSGLEPDVIVIQANDLVSDTTYLARRTGIHEGPHFSPSALARWSPHFQYVEKNLTILMRLLRAQSAREKLEIPPTLTDGFESRLEQLVR